MDRRAEDIIKYLINNDIISGEDIDKMWEESVEESKITAEALGVSYRQGQASLSLEMKLIDIFDRKVGNPKRIEINYSPAFFPKYDNEPVKKVQSETPKTNDKLSREQLDFHRFMARNPSPSEQSTRIRLYGRGDGQPTKIGAKYKELTPAEVKYHKFMSMNPSKEEAQLHRRMNGIKEDGTEK